MGGARNRGYDEMVYDGGGIVPYHGQVGSDGSSVDMTIAETGKVIDDEASLDHKQEGLQEIAVQAIAVEEHVSITHCLERNNVHQSRAYEIYDRSKFDLHQGGLLRDGVQDTIVGEHGHKAHGHAEGRFHQGSAIKNGDGASLVLIQLQEDIDGGSNDGELVNEAQHLTGVDVHQGPVYKILGKAELRHHGEVSQAHSHMGGEGHLVYQDNDVSEAVAQAADPW